MDWEIREGDEVSAPMEETAVEALLLAGQLDAGTLVRPFGRQAWKPATRHGRFAAAVRRAAAARGDVRGAGPSEPPPALKEPSRWDQMTSLNLAVAPQVARAARATLASASSYEQLAAAQPARRSSVATPPPMPTSSPATAHAPPSAVTGFSTMASMPAVTPASAAVLAEGSGAAREPGPRGAPPAVMVATPTPSPAARTTAREQGVVSGLFDLSFTTLVTTRVVKFLYVVFLIAVAFSLVAGVATALLTLIAADTSGSTTARAIGFAQLVATPLVGIVVLIVGRMMFEVVIVFFRVAEHLAAIDRKTR